MTTQAETRQKIAELTPLVNKAASWISRFDETNVNEDVAQEIWLAIFAQAAKDETFLSQKPAYIVQKGKWMAGNWMLRKGLLGQSDIELDTPISDSTTVGDLMGNRELPVEKVVVSRVMLESLIESLDEIASALAVGLLFGYSKSEIAKELGMSPASMTKATKRIRQAVAAA